MSCSIDTNVVLRLMVRDVPEQTARAVELLESVQSVEVSDVVFVETAHVLERYYQLERADIATLFSNMMSMEVVNCNRHMIGRALEYFVKHGALSFEDCYLAGCAELNGATPLYTFDKKLARQLSQATCL